MSDRPKAPSGLALSRLLRRAEKHAARVEPLLAAAIQEVLDDLARDAADRFTRLTHELALTAAAGVTSTSTMICLKPTVEQAAALAVPGGEAAGTLHVTLCYLGDTVGPLTGVAQALVPVAYRHASLAGVIGGYGAFANAGDGHPVIGLPDVPGLAELRVEVTEALANAGIDYARNHGYLPHMTLAYAPAPPAPSFPPAPLPVTFADLLVVRGDTEVVPIPLAGSPPVTASARWSLEPSDPVADVRKAFAALSAEKDPDAGLDWSTLHDRLRAVAEKHRPEGGYGDVWWHQYDRTVWWEAGDWTTGDEADAARADFMAIPEVEKVEVGWEEQPTSWAKVYSAYSEDGFAQRLTAAAGDPPPWHMPAVDEILDVDAAIKAITARIKPVRDAAVEAAGVQTLGVGMPLSEALDYYHSPKAFELNASLRSGKTLTAEQANVVQALDAAFTRAPVGGMTLWRGVSDGQTVYGDRLRQAGQWKDEGYLSTSAQESVARDFAEGTAFGDDKPIVTRIEVAEGTPVLRIPAGPFGDQDEWLLPRNLDLHFGGSVGPAPTTERAGLANASAFKGTSYKLEPSAVGPAMGISWDVTNPLVNKVLAQTASQVVDITDTTRLNVMRAIRGAWQEGLSIPHTAEVIIAGMAEASPARATLIARTELVGAVNGGSLAAVQIVEQETGATYRKVWMTAPGAQFPRHDEYEGLDGQTVALDEAFDVGGFELQHPGDPDGPPEEVCNCRCTMRYDEGDGQ